MRFAPSGTRKFSATVGAVAGCVLVAFPQTVLAGVPGDGAVIDAISDEFESPWSYDYIQNQSANGLWYVPFRGPPELLELVTPPEGAVDGTIMALRLRSIDDGDDDDPGAEDLVTVFYDNTAFGRLLERAENPSYVAWVHLPPIATWPIGQNSFGFRVAAWDSTLVSETNIHGEYYPSLWTKRGADGKGYLVARVGDGIIPDRPIAEFDSTGWFTFGISWDAEGRTEYYAAEGRGALTSDDLIYTDTRSDRRIKQAVYHFFSLRFPVTGDLSPDFLADRCRVFTKAVPNPPSLSITSVANQQISLQAQGGTPGFAWRLEKSVTLASGSWQKVGTFTNDTATHSISDSATTNAVFYRLAR